VLDYTAYKTLFKASSILLSGFQITLFRVVVGTALNLLFTYFVAYALAKRDLVGKSILTFFFFFTMLFGGGLIPTYILIKNLGLINNIWVYILPGLVSVWNMLLLRNFIMTIPESLSESADIDGAGDLVIIFRIILPLTIPALITVGLFYAVAHWNSWWDAYLYVSKPGLAPVQLVLRNILARANITVNAITGGISSTEIQPPSRSIQNAAVVITTVPIVCVYPFLQKHFIKGVLVGAVKG
jgi:putative aldouronate transport system permease protein